MSKSRSMVPSTVRSLGTRREEAIVARDEPRPLRTRTSRSCALIASAFALVILFSGSPAQAQITWQVWETWEGSTAPIYGGVNGGDSGQVAPTPASYSATHFSLIGTLGTPSGWWSVGRYLTPPSGRPCTAYAIYRGAGTFTSVQVKLEVIDAPSWTYLHNGNWVSVSRDQAWTWRSGAFTSNGHQIFVRLTLASQSGGSNVFVDDIVVQCR